MKALKLKHKKVILHLFKSNQTMTIKDYAILEDMWVYCYSSLRIQFYEYNAYGKIIEKIRNNNVEFNEDEKKNIVKLIGIFYFEGDDYEMKMLDKVRQLVAPDS